jgi:hypothetical protein
MMTSANRGSRASSFESNIEEIVTELKRVFGEGGLTSQTLVSVVTHAMTLAEQYPGLTGEDKKQLVMDAAVVLLSETGRNEGFDAVLDAVAPAMIDALVVATKDGLSINKRAKSCLKDRMCCCLFT